MYKKPLFVTGIGTGVGKTIVSAVLCEQMQADYWKPVQSGDLDHTDSDMVHSLLSNTQTIIFEEAFRFKLAASPHQSAGAENVTIRPENFMMPQSNNQLIIEGAGGLLVPLSESFLMIDLIKLFDTEVVLVIKDYLGCINHSLLSLQVLENHLIPLNHIVFNGDFNPASQEVIIGQLPVGTTWSQLPVMKPLNKNSISQAPLQI